MGPDTFLSVLQSSHSVDGDDGDDGRCTCGRRVPMRSGFCMCGKLIASAWSCTCRAPRIYHPPAPACSFCMSPPTGRAPTAEELDGAVVLRDELAVRVQLPGQVCAYLYTTIISF